MYLTCEPGGTAVGTIRRLFWSRICTPGASRTATPLTATIMSCRGVIAPAFACSGMLRACAYALAATKKTRLATALENCIMRFYRGRKRGDGGESGTRTPDTRIMIPLL